MCGATARAHRNTPRRLTWMTASNCSSLITPATAPSLYLTSWPSRRIPALLTRTWMAPQRAITSRSAEHTSELQSRENIVCRLLLEKKKIIYLVRCNAVSSSIGNIRDRAKRHTRSTQRIEQGPIVSRGCFFFIDSATTEIYTLSLHDALPI